MSPEQFKTIIPRAPVAMYSYLAAAMLEFSINTPKRQAAFLANVAEESNQLNTLVENLNYSADQLARVWPRRYATADKRPNDLAREHARMGAQTIANNVYAARMGNGDVASGDGWRYRGSGALQATGKDRHEEAAKAFSLAPNIVSEWLRTPEGACRSAARIWVRAGCNELADADDFDGCCDKINLGHKTAEIGDAIGFTHRAEYFKTACKVLGVSA